jgi:glycosyltransferase involved in cell wall biosynthesis
VSTATPSSVFFAFRDSPQRRDALRTPVGSAERFTLFGLDEITARGVRVSHNLEPAAPRWARAVGSALNKLIYSSGGYGGDFSSVLGSLRRANGAEVIFSTVDTVGIPLILLKRIGLVRRPLVYVSIGLPERLVQLRNRPMRRLYRSALREAAAVVAYSEHEVAVLRDWLGPNGSKVVFVPFGVDIEAFRPMEAAERDADVLSVGVDPRRDFELLLRVAERHPELSFRIVAGADRARGLGRLPDNVTLECDIPLDQVRLRLGGARCVALPVRANTYSGATTTLLQAMAMGKAVIVSRTAAITDGYELEDGDNCRLVEPGDERAFERAILETLTGAAAARALGSRARQTVERSLSWERFTGALWEVLSRC